MTQLQLIPTAGLELGGIKMSATALTVPADASEADLEAIGQYIKFTARGSQWVWGDYIAAVIARKGDVWDSAIVAKAWGIEDEKLRDAVAVASYFPAAHRFPGLSFTHHREAMSGCADLTASTIVLALAQEKDWSTSELRLHLRKVAADAAAHKELGGSLSAERDADAGPVRSLWVSDLAALDRIAKEKLDEGWEPDEAAAAGLLKKTRNLRALLKTIEQTIAVEV